eukprot:CAMPEP_0194136512 /NCGR_PEP_ID=MMETSP0152-20130528/6528_1 /TAXON_ID=1049557 /ORGANISM="Thalassiothrix antarctica, Strain L6-D1" /LENGTH=118 /DNA_ID=CAMNT_0038833207 /DNA_START=1 /DNA_END=357 /DNA_ORIENTATION=-
MTTTKNYAASAFLSSAPRSRQLLTVANTFNILRSSSKDDEILLEELQNQLFLTEAIETRNIAQLGSFVDEQDQWDSLEPYEQELLSNQASLEETVDTLRSRLFSRENDGKIKDQDKEV